MFAPVSQLMSCCHRKRVPGTRGTVCANVVARWRDRRYSPTSAREEAIHSTGWHIPVGLPPDAAKVYRAGTFSRSGSSPDRLGSPWTPQRAYSFAMSAMNCRDLLHIQGLCPQMLVHHAVLLHVVRLLQVQVAGDALDVDDARVRRVGELQDRVLAVQSRVRAHVERDHLHGDVRELGLLDEVLQLLAHERTGCRRPGAARPRPGRSTAAAGSPGRRYAPVGAAAPGRACRCRPSRSPAARRRSGPPRTAGSATGPGRPGGRTRAGSPRPSPARCRRCTGCRRRSATSPAGASPWPSASASRRCGRPRPRRPRTGRGRRAG